VARAGRVRALFAAWLDEEAQQLSRSDFWLAMSPLGIAAWSNRRLGGATAGLHGLIRLHLKA